MAKKSLFCRIMYDNQLRPRTSRSDIIYFREIHGLRRCPMRHGALERGLKAARNTCLPGLPSPGISTRRPISLQPHLTASIGGVHRCLMLQGASALASFSGTVLGVVILAR